MKVAVAGLWHLGSVTAACLAGAGHDVLGYDPDAETINALKNAKPPIFEPGLEALVQEGMRSQHLRFTADASALHEAEIIWVTFDTPVDSQDVADVDFVLREIEKMIPHLKERALLIISSQLPVGTSALLAKRLKKSWPEKHITLSCIPENLRLGKAIEVFTKPDRFVVGLDDPHYKSAIEALLKPFTDKLVWMSVVSAEMTKHAINAFLALSVTFINELSALCETVGANGREVEMGLKSEERIGPKAYLRPGDAIAGGTLLRDINYLTQLGEAKHRDTFLISAVKDSNHYHKQWSCRKVADLLKNLQGKKVAMLGLTYKAGTDTLRRSTAVEACEWLHQQGVIVHAYDPVVPSLPAEFAKFIQAETRIEDALHEADAVVISTAWPQFRELSADDVIANLKQPLVIDPSGYVANTIGSDHRIQYFSVGVPA